MHGKTIIHRKKSSTFPHKNRTKVLAIDFDGVLHDYKNPLPGRRMGAPLPGAKEAMDTLRRQGYSLVIFSVWGDKPQGIADWCAFYAVPYDSITNIKPNADVYLDDKAIRFTDWTDALSLIQR